MSIRSRHSKKGDNIFPKSASNSFRKSETSETIYDLRVPIHKDVLERLQKMPVLFWRSQITSGLRLYYKLINGNIELGLCTTKS